MAQQEPIFAVQAGEAMLNKFEAPFMDVKSGSTFTVTFFLGEPVVFQPAHRAKPTLTHISRIGQGYFVCASSTSDRMIPTSMAQDVLHVKLTLNDIDREVEGASLPAGERLLWRRWLEDEQARIGGRLRVQAGCQQTKMLAL